MSHRPYRSALYIPGSKTRALEKAQTLPTDVILFDLEDAVAPDEKPGARAGLAQMLASAEYGMRYKLVRINALDTIWGEDDAKAAAIMNCDAVLVPKVNKAADLDKVISQGVEKPVWAMMETPEAIINADQILGHPSLEGIVMGTNDLAKELRARRSPRREALLYSLSATLLAARRHGKVAIDGVYNAFKDEAGLEAESEQGRDMGFDGKSLIHPAQLDIANRVFAPSEGEIELAKRHIAAYDEAIAKGEAVAVVDGGIVENLHVETAKSVLAQAEAIERMM